MAVGLSENLPYPSLDGITKDECTLRMLSPAYAGAKGELTAVLQYIYQSMLFDKWSNAEYADTLEKIAISEMRHIDLLGGAIARLGALPVYASSLPCAAGYYSAYDINYTHTPQTMILADIRAESMAIEEYKKIISCIDNEQIVALVERIILDEELHLKIFRDLYCKLVNGAADS